MGISGAFFVAFIGSLLTAVPLSPAGLGTVELGVVGVLTLAYGLPTQEATTIVLVDRLISVFSIILIGSVVYLVSPIRRGVGALAADRGERARGLNGTLGEPRSGPPQGRRPGTGGGQPNGSRLHRTRPHKTSRCRTRTARASRTNG